MLTKKQINNFLKLRNNDNELNNIINVITLSMIKYYNDMSIINIIDNITIKESKRIKLLSIKDNIITINSNLTILNKIEYLLEYLNYYYNYGTFKLEGFNKVNNILQTEDIIKTLFKIVRLNNITYLEELSSINNKTYKCLIDQVETNLIRPLYNCYKKINKDYVKKDFLTHLNEEEVKEIDKLFISTDDNKDISNISESYRRIKDMINKMIKEAV